MTYHNLDNITEFSGETRKFYDGKIKLGTKLNVFNVNPQLNRHLAYRGMRHINLIAQWDNVIGQIYAEHSIPDSIKNISGVKTLLCKVRYTRIIEFQHQKIEFIKQINLFSGIELINDIRFVRVDKLPLKRKTPIPNGLKIPNEPHPKLLAVTSQCCHLELQKAFHDLAHAIMPQTKPTHTETQPTKSENLLTSWRNRAKNILNCPDK